VRFKDYEKASSSSASESGPSSSPEGQPIVMSYTDQNASSVISGDAKLVVGAIVTSIVLVVGSKSVNTGKTNPAI
jgi:hypothetical protein